MAPPTKGKRRIAMLHQKRLIGIRTAAIALVAVLALGGAALWQSTAQVQAAERPIPPKPPVGSN